MVDFCLSWIAHIYNEVNMVDHRARISRCNDGMAAFLDKQIFLIG